MLQRIHIKGYRALKDLEIELPLGWPMVLIGENASGKSTILDALSLICDVAAGRVGDAIHQRGGWVANAWAGTASEIEIKVLFSESSPLFEKERGPVEYSVRLGSIRSIPTILDEEVNIYKFGLNKKPFKALKGGAQPWLANVQSQSTDPATIAPSDGKIFTNSVLAAVQDITRYPTCLHVKEGLQSIAFYPSFKLGNSLGGNDDLQDPLGTRLVERTTRIEPSGRNLINALHTLSQEYTKEWRALLTDLNAVFPWCRSVLFPPGAGRGRITLTWVDSRSGATFYLDDMSEGMRVYLALLAALHAPDKPALIAFDEPERSLHPRALRRFVRVMESRAETVPILVATHSDRLLDFLEKPAASVGITRFSNERGVEIERLDADLLDDWRKDYSVSEMRARNMLDAPADQEEASS
jgi:predicted ATPase